MKGWQLLGTGVIALSACASLRSATNPRTEVVFQFVSQETGAPLRSGNVWLYTGDSLGARIGSDSLGRVIIATRGAERLRFRAASIGYGRAEGVVHADPTCQSRMVVRVGLFLYENCDLACPEGGGGAPPGRVTVLGCRVDA